MNYGDLKARAAVLAQMEGWSDVSPSPDWPTLVNRAWHQFSTDAELYHKTDSSLTTTTGTLEYTAPGAWKEIHDVTVNGVGLLRSTEEFERYLNPSWRVQANGTPKRWVQTAYGVVGLIPPPTTNSQAITIRGVQASPDMVLDADEPGQASAAGNKIPESFHEGIAVRAAWLQGLLYAMEGQSDRMQALDATYREYVAKAKAGLKGDPEKQPA